MIEYITSSIPQIAKRATTFQKYVAGACQRIKRGATVRVLIGDEEQLSKANQGQFPRRRIPLGALAGLESSEGNP